MVAATKGGAMYTPPQQSPPPTGSSAGSPPPPGTGSIDYSEKQPTLRVMRLYKPRLDTHRVLPSCTVGGMAGTAFKVGLGEVAGQTNLALSSALKLPDSFGNIYLGETFTAYISVLNHVPGTVLVNASLSAKLQSPSARVELDDMRMERGASVARQNPAPALQPSENLDMIVEHTLEELGTHTLRVTVKYEVAGMPEGAEPLTMRKFYRFSVMNPVSMAAKCTAIRGRPFVEMHLRNTTQMDLLLESCDFIPEEGFAASLIGGVALGTAPSQTGSPSQGDGLARRSRPWWRGTDTGGEHEAGTERDGSLVLSAVERFDRGVLLRPGESYQLVYSISGLTNGPIGVGDGIGGSGAQQAGEAGLSGVNEGGFGEGVHTLGQVELCWRTTMGESGSVLSAPVVFEASDRPEVEVTVEGIPDVLQLGRVAECVAVVHNRSRRPMTLQLQFRTDGMVGVYVHGRSFRNLGELFPGTSTRCSLQLLALVAGLHELRGCTVADMQTAQEFPQGKLRDVLVEFPVDDNRASGENGFDSDGEAQEETVLVVRGDDVL